MRSILDSKFNEFLMNEDCQMYSNFPEFVYAWLQNYTFSEVTRRCELLTPSVNDSDEAICCNFIIDLLNPKLEVDWETMTFREFLNEKASLDEIYFYLHCRFMLFRGACLENFKSTFELVNWINFAIADQVVA